MFNTLLEFEKHLLSWACVTAPVSHRDKFLLKEDAPEKAARLYTYYEWRDKEQMRLTTSKKNVNKITNQQGNNDGMMKGASQIEHIQQLTANHGGDATGIPKRHITVELCVGTEQPRFTVVGKNIIQIGHLTHVPIGDVAVLD